MKPLRLEMQAFGPFRGREVVDFARLADPLFLIAGPIGAGKTTILDAICFALYGESSGKGRAAVDLRSHHAAATAETEVTLDFAVGGKSYRISRQPTQELKKKRGDGTRTVQARGALWDRTGREGATEDGIPLAAKVRDLDERIREILGFDAAQFRQVILLPQGQFREFLAASSKDREGILKVLFDVRRCEELERELRERVQALEKRREGRAAARAEKLGEFTSQEDLARGVREKGEEVAALERHRGELAARDAAAEGALAAGRRVDGLFGELAAAERTRVDLAARAGAMDAVRLECGLAQIAEPLLPEIQALEALRAEIAEMERDLESKAAELTDVAAQKLENDRRLREHADGGFHLETAVAEIRRLEELRPRVRELERAVRERAGADEARAAVEREIAAGEHSRVQTEERLGALESSLPAARAAAGELPALEAQLRELRRVENLLSLLAAAAAEQDAAAAVLARSRDAGAAAERLLQQVQSAAEAARTRWVRSGAAALAARLVGGDPCPVCGSREHPAPAGPAADGVTAEQLQAAEDSLRAATDGERTTGAAVAAATVRVAECGVRVAGLRESLGAHAGTDAGQVRLLITQETAAAATAAAAGERLAAGEVEMAQLRERLKAASAGNVERAERLRQAAEAAVRAAAALEHLEKVLSPELRSGEAIERRVRRLSDEAATWRETQRLLDEERSRIARALATGDGFVVATRRELNAKQRRGQQAAADLAARLAKAGFADAGACRSVARTAAQIAAMRERLDAFNDTLQQAQGALEEARRKTAGLTRPDLAPLEAERVETAAALQACGQQLGRLQEQLRALSGRLGGLDDLERDEAQSAGASEALREIAAAAAGENGPKMRFSTYALAAYFDEVMVHTNRRLAVMSAGRYALARATDSSGRGFKGLDLEVYDAHTDRARPADTLSGGEGFLASLALALGLADAVQAAAGGYRLESVFIDEGFGSLDAESLELAQRCIIDLREAGRMVGLISHVEEMATWTPARIRIQKSPAGSTILA